MLGPFAAASSSSAWSSIFRLLRNLPLRLFGLKMLVVVVPFLYFVVFVFVLFCCFVLYVVYFLLRIICALFITAASTYYNIL